MIKYLELILVMLAVTHVSQSRHHFGHNRCANSDNSPFECRCIQRLSEEDRQQYQQCVQDLNDENKLRDGLQYCCAVRQYQTCALPTIVKGCKEFGIHLFELHMHSINSLCSFITGNGNRCDDKLPTPVYNSRVDSSIY